MDDISEDLLVLGRESQHRGDDAGRDVLREVTPPVDEFTPFHLVEVLVAESANLRLQCVDRTGCEGRKNDATRDRVKGRVRRDRRRATHRRGNEVRRQLVVDHDHHAAREVLRVIAERRHHLVRRREPPAAVAISVRNGAALAQVFPNWVGIVHPLRIRVVPIGGEVLDRHLLRYGFVNDVAHVQPLAQNSNRQVPWATNLARRPRHGFGVGQIESGVPLDELLDRDTHLETGQVGSSAAVDAQSKGDVAILRAVDDERVGILERDGVAVGGGKAQQNPVVLLHRTALVLHVVLHESRHGDRGVEAKELFDCHGHEIGFIDQPLQIVTVVGQMPDRRTDGGPRRVDAGDEDEDHRPEDVLHRQVLPVKFHVQQVRREVVARVGDVVFHLGHEVLFDWFELDYPFFLRMIDSLQDDVDEFEEELDVLFRETQHSTNDARWYVLRVLRARVDDVRTRHIVQQFRTQFTDHRFERIDRTGREGGQYQSTGDRVKRRIRRDRRRYANGRGQV